MSNPSDIVTRLTGLHDSIGSAIAGGFVRCETCRIQWDVTADLASRYTAKGWPTCCGGLSMRWWTARQIAAGEVPA